MLYALHFSLYSFDMRKLSAPINVHMDHVSAGMILLEGFLYKSERIMVKLNFFVRFNRKYNDLWLIRIFVFTIRLKSYTVV